METMKVEDKNKEEKKITSLKTYRRRPRSTRHIPDEVWLEIRSRLPFKSHLTTRAVCKSWKEIISFNIRTKLDVCPIFPPFCGIFLSPFSIRDRPLQPEIILRYICTRTKRVIKPRVDNSMDPNLIISSGIKTGLYSDLSFDFSPIHICNPSTSLTRGLFFSIDRGLVLVTFKDGLSQVHNPATKQVIMLPRSKTVQKHSFDNNYTDEMTGIITRYPSKLGQYCRFLVVRITRYLKIIDVYDSKRRKWVQFPLTLEEFLLKKKRWRTDNFVVLYEDGVLSLFILTTGHGIVIRFRSFGLVCYGFPLPEIVQGGIDDNIRISGCMEVLHLFYHNSTGLWIWKASSTRVDDWAWTPLLEISNCRQLGSPVGLKRLSRHVVNPADRVIPLTCHLSQNTVFLLVNSSVFAYHLKNYTFVRILDMKDDEDLRISLVVPFKPCLSNLEPE